MKGILSTLEAMAFATVVTIVCAYMECGCSDADFTTAQALVASNEKTDSSTIEDVWDSRNPISDTKIESNSPETNVLDTGMGETGSELGDANPVDTTPTCINLPYSGSGGCWSAGLDCNAPGYPCCYGCDTVTCRCK